VIQTGDELPTSGTFTVTDSNGDLLSATISGGTTTFRDTVDGTESAPALTATGAGTPSSPIVLTYTNPSGGSSSFRVNFSYRTVRTNFGCSGVGEYGPISNTPLVSSISLPDGTSYTVNYEITVGHPEAVTGRIASITLPAGGTTAYDYNNSVNYNNITCADGSTATLSRTTPDGIWTYAHSENGTAWTTNITAPVDSLGNSAYTVLNFQGIYETQRQTYTEQGGTLLQTVYTCYGTQGNSAPAPPCNNTALSGTITQRAETRQWPNSLEAQTVSTYDWNSTTHITYGLPTETDEYGYGQGAVGSLARKTTISYSGCGAGADVVDRPCLVQIFDGSNALNGKTSNSYDANGNLLSATYTTQGSSTIGRSFTYNLTGTVATATDWNANQATYTYTPGTPSCNGAFPTSVSLSQSISLSRSMTWNCNGGVMTSETDLNTPPNATSNTYNDANYWRLKASTDPSSAITNINYSTNPFSIESTLNFNGSTSTADVLTTLDELGRTHISQRKQSQGATTYDSVETDYDALGRVSKVSLPYSGTAGQTTTAAGTTTTYDALGRVTQVTDAAGGWTKYTYGSNDVLVEIGPQRKPEKTPARIRRAESAHLGVPDQHIHRERRLPTEHRRHRILDQVHLQRIGQVADGDAECATRQYPDADPHVYLRPPGPYALGKAPGDGQQQQRAGSDDLYV
jgi:YD repeat-containing protein